LEREPEYVGTKFCIRALELPDGSCPVGEFLDSLDDTARAKLDISFEMLGDQGVIKNREKFKKVEGSDKIFEFKSHQIRLLCTFKGRNVYLLHAVVKKKNKLRSQDIERAERYKQEYL